MSQINTTVKSIADKGFTRVDCPKCGGSATFSITKLNGEIKYNCFRASCGCRGIIKVGRNAEEIREIIYRKDSVVRKFEVPGHLIQGFGSMEATQWARDNNVIQAYEKGFIDLMFDPREDRLVFRLKDLQGKTVGMVGRAIAMSRQKWLIYPNSMENTPFLCGIQGSNKKTLVIVEDCASACSVSRVLGCTGMALLGTNFHTGYIPYTKGYSEYIICLDDDAKRKAVQTLLQRIKFITGKPVKIMLTRKDLKLLPLQTLEKMIDSCLR